LYFDLFTYTDSIKVNPFKAALEDLYERIKFAVVPSRECWATDVGRDGAKTCGIIRANKWKIDLGFDEWTNKFKLNGQLPLVRWMTIKENEEKKLAFVLGANLS
jgi:hypothetical protein